MNLGQTIFQLAYELSPIILQNGLAANVPGSLLPIVALTEAANSAFTILNFQNPINPNNFFAHFRPLPGGTLVDNDVSVYPFANQTYAANAIIAKPLKFSILMNCPANTNGGYIAKQITFGALKAALDTHNQAGGTYIVATPSYIYQNCIMTGLHDVSRPDSQQPQNAWQFDFIQPLVAQQPTNVLNSLMGAYQAGIQSTGLWTGVQSVLNNPNAIATPLAGANNVIGSNSVVAQTNVGTQQ
jgi:hypothetical protein